MHLSSISDRNDCLTAILCRIRDGVSGIARYIQMDRIFIISLIVSSAEPHVRITLCNAIISAITHLDKFARMMALFRL